MRKIIILIILILGFISQTFASISQRLDGSEVHITRPTGLTSGIDIILDTAIAKYLPEDALFLVSSDMSGTTADPRTWEYTINIQKLYEDDSIISLLMTTYRYTGGAHGNSARQGIVVDKHTLKQISLTDIYQPRPLVYRLGPIWRAQILSKLLASYGSIASSDRIWVREGTVDAFQYQSFTLTDRFITIYGQEYQHNAYASGVQTLRIPLTRIADNRKK